MSRIVIVTLIYHRHKPTYLTYMFSQTAGVQTQWPVTVYRRQLP
jgi:hypothetical protein